MALGQIKRSSLVDDVINQLRAEVEQGRWACGERIPTEDRLVQLLGVGRNTVREAIRALVHIGMLEVRQGAGTFVRSNRDPSAMLRKVDHATLRDQLEVRRALEVEAARLASLRRTERDLVAIRETLEGRGEWSDAASLERFVERDAAFHLSIARASHNQALIELYQYFWDSLQNTIARTEDQSTLPEPSLAAHEAIYLAIRRGDDQAAAQAAHELLTPAIDALAAPSPSGTHKTSAS